jgi:acyl-CoA synthetase (AMP-forming)/AMP-acid ligase II
MLRSSEESRAGRSDNPWDETTVAEMLDRVAAEHPDVTALVDGDRKLTFPELQAARDRMGAALVSRGITDGTHVAVRMGKGLDYTVLLHALWMIGAVAIPLNAMWTGREVERALVDTDAEALIIDTSTDATDWRSIVTHLGLPTDGVLEGGRSDRLVRVIDGSAHRDLWSEGAEAASEQAGSVEPLRSARQESLFLFTSGSSSAPKAVVLRQDGILGTARYFAKSLGLGESERFLTLGPYFHAGGIVQMLVANQSAATQYVFPKVDIPTIAAVAVKEGCTVVTGFDPVLVKLFEAIAALGSELPFHSVAASPAVEVFDDLRSRGVTVVTMYAMSEGGNMVSLSSPEDEVLAHGRALPGVSIRICDTEGRPVAQGEEGEICFKGWNLFRGYYNVSDEPGRAATDADDYFHTGDIGKIDDMGRLVYLGRFSSMIKSAGENVSATEVETFLVRELPEVATAAVVGVPSAAWGEAVVAFVELVPEARPFEESWLKDACRGKLAGYKIPKQFVQVTPDSWPVADTGKLSRVTLVESFLAETSTLRQ